MINGLPQSSQSVHPNLLELGSGISRVLGLYSLQIELSLKAFGGI